MTISGKKEYLNSYAELNKEINKKIEDLAELQAYAERTTSVLSERVKGGESTNKLQIAVERIIELQKRINIDIDRFVDLRLEMEEKINKIDDMKLCLLLKLRYIDEKKWSDIARLLYCNPKGKAVYKMQDKALSLFEKDAD